MVNAAEVEVLNHAECLFLLASTPVGRIVFTDSALPAVEPVSFVMDDGAIVFRTEPGAKLTALAENNVVAFEADDFDPEQQTGWSVTAVGRANEVTEAELLADLRNTRLCPSAPGPQGHYVRVHIENLTGRRIGGTASV